MPSAADFSRRKTASAEVRNFDGSSVAAAGSSPGCGATDFVAEAGGCELESGAFVSSADGAPISAGDKSPFFLSCMATTMKTAEAKISRVAEFIKTGETDQCISRARRRLEEYSGCGRLEFRRPDSYESGTFKQRASRAKSVPVDHVAHGFSCSARAQRRKPVQGFHFL